MKKVLTRLISTIMATIMIVTALPSISALYVTTEWYSYTYNFDGRLGRGFWGQIPKFSTADGNIAYCIQENVNSFSGDHYVQDIYDSFSANQRANIKYALIYGYKGYSQYGYSNDEERLATQFMCWLIVYNWYNTSYEEAALNIYTENMPSTVANNVKAVYSRMKEEISEHETIPSFTVSSPPLLSQATYELLGGAGNYTITLADSHYVLNRFEWSYSGVTVTPSENTMTITSSNPIDSVNLNGTKVRGKYINQIDYVTPVYLTSPVNQDKVTMRVDDPVRAFLQVYAKEVAGSLEVTKVFKHENGVIDGLADYSECRFIIAERGTSNYVTTSGGSGTYAYTGTTSQANATQLSLNSSLKFTVSNLPADKHYDIYEVAAPSGYTFNASSSLGNARVIAGDTVRTTINNTRITLKGGIEIYKTSEDEFVGNMTFTVKGSDGSSRTITTNSAGYGSLGNLPVYTIPTSPTEAPKLITYTIDESPVALRYISPASQNNSLTANSSRTFNFNNVLKKGNLRIVKTSVDGKISDVKFTILGSDGSSRTISTNSSGIATLNNLPVYNSQNQKITYTVKETNTELRYYEIKPETVTLDTDSTVSVSFNNVLKKGTIRIDKSAEDGLKSGLVFEVKGSGYSFSMTTNASGTAVLNNVPVYDVNNKKIVYTIYENNVPIRYVIPKEQTSEIFTDNTTTLAFNNILKKFRVTVSKVDNEIGMAQGDGKLSGAAYGIYDNGTLVDTYTTDKDGKFTTKYYICGSNWTIKEITPSEGYLIDPTVHRVGAEAKDYTIELNNAPALTSREQVIKGKIAIVKHTDQPNGNINPNNPKVQQPEANAQFEVFLVSSGSYANAQPYNRDLITTDENGYAQTKSLPYGIYTVKQVKGTDGHAFVEPFNVFISQNDKVYSFILENPVFDALIEIVKIDAETGKTIPLIGTGFKIKDLSTGEWISQHINYPTPMDIDTFYTDMTGKLMLPYGLNFGNYELYEVEAPYNYFRNPAVIPFKVDGTQTQLTIKMPNTPQKGTISISKSGEVFSTIEEHNDGDSTIYRPVYEVKGLPNAHYNVIAVEDIYMPDGTLRASEGEVVCSITTDEDGLGTSSLLYLGDYKVVEVDAPFGHTLNDTEYTVSLNYGGQEIEILDTVSVLFVNDRQKVKIQLSKLLETDKLFRIGINGEYTNILFGLYASENITATDGTFIPADGLIETIGLNVDLTGEFTVDLPFGEYYVKEIATDEHYILNDSVYPIVFEYVEQNTDIVTIEVNNGDTIVNTLKRGEVQGLKVGEVYDPLAEAVIGLFKLDEVEFTVDSALMYTVTGSEGVFYFADIPFGNWLVREIQAPTGYVLGDSVFIVEITEDGDIVEIEIENTLIRGNIQGLKVGENDNPLENAVFGIFAPDETEFIEETALMISVSDENGVFSFKDVLFGEWLIREIEPPTGYVLNETLYSVEITVDGQIIEIEIEIENTLIRGEIQGLKVSDNNEPLSDAVIGLFNANETEYTKDTALMVSVTGKDGVFAFKDVLFGQWIVREIEPPTGYILNDTAYQVEITENEQIINIEIENVLIRGNIQGLKVSNDDEPLAGAVFGLFAPDETVFTVESALITTVTESDGIFYFTDVPFGEWVVREIEAPTGYVLNESVFVVEIKEDGEVIEIEVENILIRGEIRGLKVDEDENPLVGAVFGLFKADETTFTKETALTIAVTDIDGIFIFSDVAFGQWIVREIEAPTGYFLNETVYEVDITENGEVIEIEIINVKIPEAPSIPDIPNTGVNSNVFALGLLTALSFVTMIISSRKRSRRFD